MKKKFDGFFREIELSRGEYVSRWDNHVAEVMKLCYTEAEFDSLQELRKIVMQMAGRSWDRS